MLKAYDRLRFPRGAKADLIVERVQDRIEDFARKLTVQPGLDAVLLEGVVLAYPTTVVTHGLRRQPRGWRVVDAPDATALAVYRTAWDSNTITLNSPDATTINLEVF